MMQQVQIKVLRLVDVDPFGTALPFVRVTAPSGEVQSTSTSTPDKSHSKYSFAVDSPVNSLVFEVAAGVNQFSVNVFSRETADSEQVAQYPGIGRINVSTDDARNANAELTCPLYEDGDEMLEIGALIYTYNFVEASAEADLDADDFNIASLEASPRGKEDDNLPTERQLEKDMGPEPEASYDDTDIFEREQRREENMEEFLNDDAFDELNSLGTEELIVSPELHIKEEHVQDDEHRNALQTLRRTTICNTVAAPEQEWIKYADSTQNQFIPEVIRADLARFGAECNKITVRLHSAIFSSARALDATVAATIKMCVLPTPNKAIALRSVTNKPDTATAANPDTATSGTVSTTFSFGLKTAIVGMGAGDVRSKCFREGACPRLFLEVSLGGSEGYTAFTELYLPSLLSDCSGQVLSIPLVCPLRTEGTTEEAPITCSLLFELNPADLLGATNNNNTVQVSLPPAARTGLLPPGPGTSHKSTKRSTKATPHSTQAVSPLIDNIPTAMNVEFNLQGICGEALDGFPNLKATATLEAYLTSSGAGEAVSFTRLVTQSTMSSAFGVKRTISLRSVYPKMDILQLRVRTGNFPEDEIGRVCIPLVALLQKESNNEIVGRTVALNALKWSNSSVSGVYLSAKWKFIGSLSFQATESETGMDAETSSFPHTFQPDQSGFPEADMTNNSNGRTLQNNWTTSPGQNTSAFGSPQRLPTAPGTTSFPSTNKPVLVKSVSGRLLGSVKGYFSARAVIDRTQNQENEHLEGTSYFGKGNVLSAEVTMMPEGLRKKTNSATAVAIASGDIDNTVEWSKGFSMFLTYASQQRQVPYLQINVFSDRAAGVDRPASHTLIASTRLDLSTLISYPDSPLLQCLVPVSHMSESTSGVLSRQDVSGWLLVGLQFRAGAGAAAPAGGVEGGDAKAFQDQVDQAMQAQWASLGASATQYCLGLSPHGELNTGAAVHALQLNPQKLRKTSLHVALSAMQLASLVQGVDEDMTCVVKVGNDLDCVAQIFGSIRGDRVIWHKSDAVLKFVRESSVSLCLYAYLLRGHVDVFSNDPSGLIAEANMALSLDQLQKGLPMNFVLPLRDHQGERSATLPLSVQLTTICDNESGADTTPNFLSQTIGTSGITPVPLRVEFCEGNIAESELTQHTEPFFECSILLPEQEELLAGPALSTRARTGFLRLSEKLEHWGLDCTVHVPPSSVSQISAATSTILSNSRSFAATGTTTQNLNNGVCILGVVCRDASKQGCPEIGWARVALPRSLILQSKPIEQWITLTPPNILSATVSAQQYATLPSGPGSSGAGKHSRMKLRITVDYKDYDAAYAPFGVGAVLVRMVGVHDARAGVNDDLVSAKVASYAWENGAPPLGDDFREDNMFSQSHAHPASYINEMSIFNEENLVGSLPVTGGFGDIKLNVKTFTTNVAYTAAFPIMAATTKASESGEMPPIPLLNLNLSRERATQPSRARLEPQLQLNAAYVPYVNGKLVLHCTEVEIITPPAEVGVQTVLRDFTNPLALRFLLGNNSSRFVFSRPFELNGVSSAGNKKTLFAPVSRSSGAINGENVTFMEVDTFEVISNSIRRGESFSMIPLFVSLLEQWDLLDPVVDRRGQQACVGVGYVSTAALYYQALRAAASAPMQPSTGPATPSAPSPAVTPSAPLSLSQNVASTDTLGASPWLVTKVDIFDPKNKLRVAVVSLNIQFVMRAVPEHVVRMLSSSVARSLTDPSAKARVELGLKQSFVLADVDKSGAVSSAELLQVIAKSGQTRMRRSATTSKLALPAKGETIGMENAVELLLQLANVPDNEMEQLDEQSLVDMVRKIFVQLDVDGDGLVSWWEWKSVLTASILGPSADSRFMYHMDSLAIGMQAAHDALKTLSPPQCRSLEDVYDSKASTTHSMLPYIRLKMKTFDNIAEPVIYEDEDAVFSGADLQVPPSKAVGRLHSMVKSLRLTNSILAKRFERALSAAQHLAIDLDQDGLPNGATGAGASRQGAKLSEIEHLEARIHDTERQSESNLTSFLTAKERADQLAAQLNDMHTSNSIIQLSKSNPDLFTFNSSLEKDIETNAEKLRRAQDIRKQRTLEVFSAFRLKALVAKLIMPRVHERRRNKAAEKLTHMMQNQSVRRKYLSEKQRREEAALAIQGVSRGHLGRKKVKLMHDAATQAQNLYRSRTARRRVNHLRGERAQQAEQERLRELEMKRNLAAFTITRAVRTCGENLTAQKNSAALRLQQLLKQRMEFKAAKQVVDEKRAARDRKSVEERRLADELAEMQRQAKLREEEERRKEEAARLLTKTVAARGVALAGRKIHAFLAAQRALVPLPEKPSINSARGLWVNYSNNMYISPRNASPRDPTARRSSLKHFGRGNFGQIQEVNLRTRTMDVLFLYNMVESSTPNKSGAKFEVEKLPYDHPLLDYYTSEQPKVGYWVSYTERGEHHWLPFRPYTDRPEQLHETLGYKVGLKVAPEVEPEEGPGALYAGRIVAFDRNTDTVTILFDSVHPEDPPEQEEVHWTSPEIQWLMPATVSRPKTIEESPGYNVEVNKAASETTAHRVLRGTVIRCDPSAQTVRVVYAPAAGAKEATEVENLPFESAQISWLNRVHPSKIPTSPRPTIPHGPSFSKNVITTRPKSIVETVGHMVEVASNDEGAEPGDMFPGVVVAANSSNGMVRVLYDTLEPKVKLSKLRSQRSMELRPTLVAEMSALSDGTAEGEEPEDFEDLHWMSPDILWVIAETTGVRVDPHRPKELQDCVGALVDVMSHEPDAVEGDFFSGTVVLVDETEQTIRVLFDGVGNGEDYEDIPWNSPDILWPSEESVRGREERAESESIGEPPIGDQADAPADSLAKSPAKPEVKGPVTLAEAEGWNVTVDAELKDGKVVSVDSAKESVWVVFDFVKDASAPLQVKLHWESSHIEWLPTTVTIDPKVPALINEIQSVAKDIAESAVSAATSPRDAAGVSPAPAHAPALKAPPTLAASMGWTVEIRASEAEDEVYVGEVAGFDEAEQTVKILFAGEDGTLQQDDAEFLPWKSDQLHWVEGPAVAVEGSSPMATTGTAAAELDSMPKVVEKAIELQRANEEAAANTKPTTKVLEGKPQRMEDCADRHVHVTLRRMPGFVTQTSNSLQTVNLALQENNQDNSPATMVVGAPFASSMIVWVSK